MAGVAARSSRARSCRKCRYFMTPTFATLEQNRVSRPPTYGSSNHPPTWDDLQDRSSLFWWTFDSRTDPRNLEQAVAFWGGRKSFWMYFQPFLTIAPACADRSGRPERELTPKSRFLNLLGHSGPLARTFGAETDPFHTNFCRRIHP